MNNRKILNDWQFRKAGAAQWQSVTLPHDAMLTEARIPSLEKGTCTAYFPGGKYEYRKVFRGEGIWASPCVILELEGVYMNSTVLLNGEKAGGWIYGYTGYYVNLSGKIRVGEDNELLVEADNSMTPNSRWYSGSGIYRPVRLWYGQPAHFVPEGLRVKTVSTCPAVISVKAETEGADNDMQIIYEVYDGDACIAVGSGIHSEITVPGASLWSAENPKLYTIRALLKKGKELLDTEEIAFGIRSLSWNTERGFLVNGESVKLRGGCIHHDNGILGACTYETAEERKIRRLKEFGFNAIRFSHYPAGKDLLNVCDRLGMYVLDESFDQWRRPNTKYDYSTVFDAECVKDISALARKDYNHPSVVMYSIGNEIVDTGRSYGAEIAELLCSTIRSIDDTRPITIANNAPMSIVADAMEKLEKEKGAVIGSLEINELIAANPDLMKAYQSGGVPGEKLESLVGKVFDELDITGHNYGQSFYESFHACRPQQLLLSTETFPARMASNWKWVADNVWCIGDFHWTAWDYLGETGVGLPVYGTEQAPFDKPYPCLTAACGSFDLIGEPEPAAYYSAILWGKYKAPYIAVRPVNHSGEKYTLGMWRLTDAIACWTWPDCEGRMAEITVYAAGEAVELLIDGKSLGRKKLTDCKADFETPYVPGVLTAVSYDADGKEIGRCVLATAGSSTRLELQPEAGLAGDLIYVPIHVTDDTGILKMTEDVNITVSVGGAAELLAFGSGRPDPEMLFDGSTCKSWHGCALAVLRRIGKGNVLLTVSAPGCCPVTARL